MPLLLLPAIGARGHIAAAGALALTPDGAAMGLAIGSHDCDRMLLRVTSRTDSVVYVRAGDSTAARFAGQGDLVLPIPAGSWLLPGVEQMRHRRKDRTLLLGFGDGFAGEVEAMVMP